jgi:hypothetical protein
MKMFGKSLRCRHNYWPLAEVRDIVFNAEDLDGNFDNAFLWKCIALGKIDVNDECIGPGNVVMPILAYAIECTKQKTALKLLELGASPHVSYESSMREGEFKSPASAAIDQGCRDVLCALMDMGFSAQTTCRTLMIWMDEEANPSDDDDGWKESTTSMLEYALEHGSRRTLRCILTYKYIPTEILENHRHLLRKHGERASVLNEAIFASRALEAAWCTAWVTYSVVRRAWRDLCPMIVDRMVVIGKDEENEKEELVSKKIKV